VGPPKPQRAILAALARRVPSLPREIQAGRLVRSQYLAGGRAQLDYFESELIRAPRAEGELLCVVGDLADGGPERGKAFARLLEYEAEYDRRIARRFPVVTLCQYDARRLSGLEALATLQSHPDAFRYPGSSVLA
jgi:transcriptional repressor of dcmA and dcmR